MGDVILVHGLAANRLFMAPLARYLRGRDFSALNWGYWSSRGTVERHAHDLVDRLMTMERAGHEGPIHFVGHSMGSIVIRAALELHRPRHLGRVVMLAPPNHGSHVARRLSPLLGWFCPALGELSDDDNSYVNRLAPPYGYEFAVIAAEYDWVIEQQRTKLEGLQHFATVRCNHGLVPWHPQAIAWTCQFLLEGRLEPGER